MAESILEESLRRIMGTPGAPAAPTGGATSALRGYAPMEPFSSYTPTAPPPASYSPISYGGASEVAFGKGIRGVGETIAPTVTRTELPAAAAGPAAAGPAAATPVAAAPAATRKTRTAAEIAASASSPYMILRDPTTGTYQAKAWNQDVRGLLDVTPETLAKDAALRQTMEWGLGNYRSSPNLSPYAAEVESLFKQAGVSSSGNFPAPK